MILMSYNKKMIILNYENHRITWKIFRFYQIKKVLKSWVHFHMWDVCVVTHDCKTEKKRISCNAELWTAWDFFPLKFKIYGETENAYFHIFQYTFHLWSAKQFVNLEIRTKAKWWSLVAIIIEDFYSILLGNSLVLSW